MKILEAKKHQYKILKSFSLGGGKTAVVGAILELPKCVGFIEAAAGRAEPVAVPEMGLYRAARAFKFELSGKLLEVKRGETLEIKKQVAIRLMLDAKLFPLDSETWCPHRERKVNRTHFIDTIKIPGKGEIKVSRPIPERPVTKPFMTSWKK